MLSAIKKFASPRRQNPPEEPSLFNAAKDGKLDTVDQLLAEGHNPNGNGGEYPILHAAARKPNNAAVIGALIANNVKLETVSRRGITAVQFAAMEGNTLNIIALLESRANVNTLPLSDSALHYAAANNHYTTAIALLLRGADTSATNTYGRIPAELAKTPKMKTVLQSSMDELKARAAKIGLDGLDPEASR